MRNDRNVYCQAGLFMFVAKARRVSRSKKFLIKGRVRLDKVFRSLVYQSSFIEILFKKRVSLKILLKLFAQVASLEASAANSSTQREANKSKF